MTPKQKAFIEEYLVDLNATQAAIRAGYAKKTADVTGPRLLGNVRVAAAIAKRQQERSERVQITQDAVLSELMKLGFSNMMDYMTVKQDGTAYVDLSKLTREQAAAIQEITVDEYIEGRGDDAHLVKKVKVKLADKKSSLELLGKHLGMFADRLKADVDGSLTIKVEYADVDFNTAQASSGPEAGSS